MIDNSVWEDLHCFGNCSDALFRCSTQLVQAATFGPGILCLEIFLPGMMVSKLAVYSIVNSTWQFGAVSEQGGVRRGSEVLGYNFYLAASYGVLIMVDDASRNREIPSTGSNPFLRYS